MQSRGHLMLLHTVSSEMVRMVVNIKPILRAIGKAMGKVKIFRSGTIYFTKLSEACAFKKRVKSRGDVLSFL